MFLSTIVQRSRFLVFGQLNYSTQPPATKELTQLPASHNHVKLWNALLGGNVRFQVKHPDGVVDTVSDITKATALTIHSSTAEEIEWLHTEVKTLFLRPHIHQVFGEVERVWTTRNSGFAVIGTPGIGKSVQFGNYVFYQAAKAKRNVFFDQVSGNVGYLFKADGSVFETMNPASFGGVNAEKDLGWDGLYLMDSGAKGIHREPKVPGSISAFTVVTASPNEKHYGNWLKTIGTDQRLIISPWTWEEVTSVLPWVTLPDEDNNNKEAVVKERFDKLGGIPRFLFGRKTFYEDALRTLESQFGDMNEFNFRRLKQAENRWEVVPNFVFLLKSVPPFRPKDCSLQPASPWIEEGLVKALSTRKLKLLGDFVDLAGDITVNVPAGHAFEEIVLQQLKTGGTFTVKNILDGKNAEEHLSLPPLNIIYHSNETMFTEKFESGTLIKPQAKNFPEVDFIFLINEKLYLGQVTLNVKKVISPETLQELMIKLNSILPFTPSEVFILYFLKKDKNFDQFKLGKQRELTSWNTSGKSPKFIPKKVSIVNE